MVLLRQRPKLHVHEPGADAHQIKDVHQRQLRIMELGQLVGILDSHELRGAAVPDHVARVLSGRTVHEPNAVSQPHVQQRQLRLLERLGRKLRGVILHAWLHQPQQSARRYGRAVQDQVVRELSGRPVHERNAVQKAHVQQRLLLRMERVVRKLRGVIVHARVHQPQHSARRYGFAVQDHVARVPSGRPVLERNAVPKPHVQQRLLLRLGLLGRKLRGVVVHQRLHRPA